MSKVRPYFVPMVMRGIFFAGSVFAALLTAFIQEWAVAGIAALFGAYYGWEFKKYWAASRAHQQDQD